MEIILINQEFKNIIGHRYQLIFINQENFNLLLVNHQGMISITNNSISIKNFKKFKKTCKPNIKDMKIKVLISNPQALTSLKVKISMLYRDTKTCEVKKICNQLYYTVTIRIRDNIPHDKTVICFY